MSYDVKQDTIRVDDTEYDIEREDLRTGFGERLTVTLDGEPVFPGLSATIAHEDYIEEYMNPRADYDGILGVMLTRHRSYNLGGGKDDDEAPDEFTIECDACEGTGETFGPENYTDGWYVRPPNCPVCEGVGEREVHPVEWAKQVHGARVCLPLCLYDHGGISMSAGTFGSRPGYPYDCQWDAGIVGIVFDTADTRKACGWEDRTDEEIEADLRREVEVYDWYLRGQVFHYRVEDSESGYEDGCGGMLDDWDRCYVDGEAFESLEIAIQARLNEDAERNYWTARDVETVA